MQDHVIQNTSVLHWHADEPLQLCHQYAQKEINQMKSKCPDHDVFTTGKMLPLIHNKYSYLLTYLHWHTQSRIAYVQNAIFAHSYSHVSAHSASESKTPGTWSMVHVSTISAYTFASSANITKLLQVNYRYLGLCHSSDLPVLTKTFPTRVWWVWLLKNCLIQCNKQPLKPHAANLLISLLWTMLSNALLKSTYITVADLLYWIKKVQLFKHSRRLVHVNWPQRTHVVQGVGHSLPADDWISD